MGSVSSQNKNTMFWIMETTGDLQKGTLEIKRVEGKEKIIGVSFREREEKVKNFIGVPRTRGEKACFI